MDRSNEEQDFESLGFPSFDGVSLRQLSDAIAKNLPLDIDKKRSLNLYVMWLHGRLVALDVTDEASFTAVISGWYQFLKALAYDDPLVFEAVRGWRRKQAPKDLAGSRRFMIAETELRMLVNVSSTGSRPIPAPPRAEDGFGQMHPDRVRQSRAGPLVIEIDDDDDDDDDDGNSDIVFVSSNPVRKDRSTSHDHRGNEHSDLSFLTGSNMVPLNSTQTPFSQMKRGGLGAPDEPTSPSPKPHTTGQIDLRTIRPNQCGRCGKMGHTPTKCPTTMDPSYDRKPPRHYKCYYCNESGDHFSALCPEHPNPASVGRQRQLAKGSRGKNDTDHTTHSDGAARGDHRLQRNNNRRVLAGGDSRGRGRPRFRDLDPDGWDRYSPADDFARLHLSPMNRSRRSKRKATRSPSPGPWKRRDPWASTSGWAYSTGKPGRPVDEREGRLSYDDEVSVDASFDSPTDLTISSPGVEKMDIDVEGTPTLETEENNHRATRDLLAEADILDMIRTESTKTDRLILVDGVERIPGTSPLLAQLFKTQGNIWANKAPNKTRLRAVDFFGSPAQEEGQIQPTVLGLEADTEPAPEDAHAYKVANLAMSPDVADQCSTAHGEEKMADIHRSF